MWCGGVAVVGGLGVMLWCGGGVVVWWWLCRRSKLANSTILSSAPSTSSHLFTFFLFLPSALPGRRLAEYNALCLVFDRPHHLHLRDWQHHADQVSQGGFGVHIFDLLTQLWMLICVRVTTTFFSSEFASIVTLI